MYGGWLLHHRIGRRFVGLVQREETALHGFSSTVTLRMYLRGHICSDRATNPGRIGQHSSENFLTSWPIPAHIWRGPPGGITRCKLAVEVAKRLEEFRISQTQHNDFSNLVT